MKKITWQKHYYGNDVLTNKRGVYKIYLKHNPQKVYVGSTPSLTTSIPRRWYRHWYNLTKDDKHHSIKLYRAVKKHGIESLVFEVLEFFNGSPEEMIQREQYWIDSLNAFKKGYNCVEKAGCTTGFKMPKKLVNQKSVPILQYDLNGVFIKEWESIAEIKRHGICFNKKVLENNSNYSAGGFLWLKKESDNFPKQIQKYAKTTSKPVLVYTLSGNFHKKFNSILEAALYFSADAGTLVNTLKCNGNAKQPIWHNYIFKYMESDKYPLKIKPLIKKTGFQFKVEVFNQDTGEHKIYNSLRQASENTGLSRQQMSKAINAGKTMQSYKTKHKFIIKKYD